MKEEQISNTKMEKYFGLKEENLTLVEQIRSTFGTKI